MAILDKRLPTTPVSPLTAAKPKPRHEPGQVAGSPAGELDGSLRIGAALRAAHQDSVDSQPPETQEQTWGWKVKALPRPPLAVVTKEALDREGLLENDSLGG